MPLISFHILNKMSLTPPLLAISQDHVEIAEPLVKHPKIQQLFLEGSSLVAHQTSHRVCMGKKHTFLFRCLRIKV